MAQRIKIENGTHVNCFVPSCSNKKIIAGKPLHFFQVPRGNEGLRWKEAVNSTQPQYEKTIGILRRKTSASIMHCCEVHFNIETDAGMTVDENGSIEYHIKPGVLPSIKPRRTKRLWQIMEGNNSDTIETDAEMTDGSIEYQIKPSVLPSIKQRRTKRLWENMEENDSDTIETDAEMTVDENGSIKYQIKTRILPSIKQRRTKRLLESMEENNSDTLQEIDCDDTNSHLLQPIKNPSDSEAIDHKRDFISIVDMSTLICNSFKNNTFSSQQHNEQTTLFDHQIEVKHEPMMPLTVDLMRRKSLYYMGLEWGNFSHLLQIIESSTNITDSLMEMKIMLTLRKHRLNEEFEALGDLFDIDKTTAQQYYDESKDLVSNLYHSVSNSIPNTIFQESADLDVKNPIWTENHLDVGSYKDGNAHEQEKKFQNNSSESDASIKNKYKGYYEFDSDVDSDDLDDSEDSVVGSDELYNSDMDSESADSLVKEMFPCPICKKYFGRLDYHIETVHLNPQYLNKTICGLCLEKFETNAKLRDHQKDIHNGNACACDICNKMFSKYSDVKLHILYVHLKLKSFLCHICGSTFATASKLRVHAETKHLSIRKHACHLCDKKYFQSGTLQAHVRSVHTKERPYKCTFEGCSKSFSRHGNLCTHEQMHKAKFECKICTKTFSFKHNLVTHSKNIHGQNVINLEECKIELC